MEKKFLNTVEASNLLGITKAQVSTLFQEGFFPNAFRVGNAIRIPSEDIKLVKKQPWKEAV